jgi:hypothetical protein
MPAVSGLTTLALAHENQHSLAVDIGTPGGSQCSACDGLAAANDYSVRRSLIGADYCPFSVRLDDPRLAKQCEEPVQSAPITTSGPALPVASLQKAIQHSIRLSRSGAAMCFC